MQERKARPRPFQNSLSALARIAVRETSADGYALFRLNSEDGKLARHDETGLTIEEDAALRGQPGIVTYRVGHDGIVAFAFHDEGRSLQVRPELDRIAALIESVWLAAQAAGRYSELASEVADLELRLMDSKIADRVRGYLNSHEGASPVDAIARHVEGILRPASAGQVLEQLTRDLEEAVEERRLTNRAKVILQNAYGMSEEQAHMHLRQISRKTRRKLKDVAADLIERNPADVPTA
jgi:AmiR/NasT family two-component response regulator